MPLTHDDMDPPVTVSVIRQVKPGCELAFETLAAQLSKEAKLYPGHLGTNLFRPPNSELEYHIIYKFDCMSHFHAWEISDIRAKYYKEILPLLVKEPEVQILSGLETWFDLPYYKGTLITPPRYKMAIISWLAIYPLIVVILECLSPILTALPIPLRAAIITLIAIPSMTYILMPYMARIFSAWLYPQINKTEP